MRQISNETKNHCMRLPYSYELTTHDRYFYQGSEMDKEVKGDGNSYTTTFRQLDPRLGRWMSLDPLMYVFPWQTPYNSMDNNPIYFNDIFGLKSEGWGGKKNENGTTSWDYDSEITKDNYKSKGYTEYMDEGYLAKGINRETGETGEWWLTKEGKGVNYSKLDETIINSNNIEKQQNNVEISSNSTNKSKGTQINEGGFSLYKFGDDAGQLVNVGGVVWGTAQMGGQYLQQNNGAQVIGRSLGFGTQKTAKALSGTVKTLGNWGKNLGTFGMVFSSVNYVTQGLDPNQKISTATHVNFWFSAVLYGASAVIGGPIIGSAALIYGAGQLGSYMFTGNTLEENILGK